MPCQMVGDLYLFYNLFIHEIFIHAMYVSCMCTVNRGCNVRAGTICVSRVGVMCGWCRLRFRLRVALSSIGLVCVASLFCICSVSEGSIIELSGRGVTLYWYLSVKCQQEHEL